MIKAKLGILGGGQLGMFICQAAKEFGITTTIFSQEKIFSAKKFCDNYIVGRYSNSKLLDKFIRSSDFFTIETENIPKEILRKIGKEKKIFPSSKIIEISQNRIKEKKFINSINGIKTVRYFLVNNYKDLVNGFNKLGGKALLKSCQFGYDGKDQYLIKKSNINEFKKKKLENFIIEEFLDFKKEISVIISRTKKNMINYPPVENLHKNSILKETLYPAVLDEKIKKNAIRIAKNIAINLELIGILAIEMFVLKNNDILINELAPRPHNSGHWTLDCCKFSQYENLLFSIFKSKVKEPIPTKNCKMINLIGEDYKKIKKLKKEYKCYDYHKKEIRPKRKMGHYIIIKK